MPGKGCRSKRKHTPITSEAQRGAMGIAYAAKKGEVPVSKLRGPSKEMYKSMPQAELKRHLKESKGKKLVARKHRKSKKSSSKGHSGYGGLGHTEWA